MFKAICKLGLEGIVSKNQRAIQVRVIKGVAENQKSQSSGSYALDGWHVLKSGF
jgi:hypothetical protein